MLLVGCSRSTPASAPCAEGQVKGDRASGTYLLPDDPLYAQTHNNVLCFDAELEAVAGGFRARGR